MANKRERSEVYLAVRDLAANERVAEVERLTQGWSPLHREKLVKNLANHDRQAELDRERASRPPVPPPDPYWSLWRKIKDQFQSVAVIADSDDYECGGGVRFKIAEMAIEEIEETTCRLPRRGIEVSYDGQCLRIGDRKKHVKDDRHAVNSLRKLDADDSYYADWRQGF